MATTSKSPKRILLAAHYVGRQTLQKYSHRYSPKKFTLPQLFACLVLKEFLRLDYRKLSALLEDAPSLAAAIGLGQIPHFTTFQKAAARLLVSRRVARLLDETIQAAAEHGVMRKKVALAAIDGTGFETRHISSYFVRRRDRACKTGYQTTTYTRYPAANLLCDCRSHLVLAVVAGRGPGPDDPYFQPTLKQAVRRVQIETLLADAGYDSEAAHVFAREQCGARTIIPATRGRPTKRRLKGYWRDRMRRHLNKKKYGQRWQVETVNSMIKRSMGSALRARNYWSQSREIILRVLTHNIMILWRNWVFYRAVLTPFARKARRATASKLAVDVAWWVGPPLKVAQAAAKAAPAPRPRSSPTREMLSGDGPVVAGPICPWPIRPAAWQPACALHSGARRAPSAVAKSQHPARAKARLTTLAYTRTHSPRPAASDGLRDDFAPEYSARNGSAARERPLGAGCYHHRRSAVALPRTNFGSARHVAVRHCLGRGDVLQAATRVFHEPS